MKRLISMILAVMLIATLGVLPVCAVGHTDHFIKFLDSNGEESSTIILPPATVGREYSYTIGTSSCGHFPIAFELDRGDLPDGLTLNADGTISGIPTTPTEETIELVISASGSCPESDSGYEIGNEATFYLAVDSVRTMTIPFSKVVDQTGRKSPGRQTFYLEVYGFNSRNIDTDLIAVTGDAIDTNGSGNYPGRLNITYPDRYYGDMLEGFYVREKQGHTAHWTYSDMVWFIKPVRDEEMLYIREENENGSTRDAMLFINQYYNSPSRDDDDYDPPVREPQKDEPKSNPSTGRGTTWDYLVYLFHKYFSWAA